MANTFKNACAAVGTSRTDIYTCPSSTAAVIHSVYLSSSPGIGGLTDYGREARTLRSAALASGALSAV